MEIDFVKLVNMLHRKGMSDKKEVKVDKSQNENKDFQKGGENHDNNNNKSRDKRKCNFCGIVGHVIQDCRKKKMKMGACFQCGDTGHISKNCPKKQGQAPQAGPSGVHL